MTYLLQKQFIRNTVYQVPLTPTETVKTLQTEIIQRSRYRTDAILPKESFQGKIDESGFEVVFVRRNGLQGFHAVYTGTIQPQESGSRIEISSRMSHLGVIALYVSFVLIALLFPIVYVREGLLIALFVFFLFVGLVVGYYQIIRKKYMSEVDKAMHIFDRLLR